MVTRRRPLGAASPGDADRTNHLGDRAGREFTSPGRLRPA
jgi:hypothetical protein